MTITNDDPEIVVGDIGVDDGAPSAPTQASVIVGEQQTTLPLASAVIATPINNTTTTTAATSELLPSQETIQLASGNGSIERSTNPDGSLAVKVITTTRQQQTGYNEITTEYFHIPANMANTVLLTLAAGVPPSSLYRTNMNTRTETISTPINATAIAPTPIATTTQSPPNNYPTATTTRPNPHSDWNTSVEDQRKKAGQLCTVFAVIAVIIIAIVAVATHNPGDHSSPTPSWSSNDDDYYPSPYTPTYPSYPSPLYPTRNNEPCKPHVSPNMAPILGCKVQPARPCVDAWESEHADIYNCIPLYPTRSPQPTISNSPTYSPTVSNRPTISSRPTINYSFPAQYLPNMWPPATDRMKIHSPIDNSDISNEKKEEEKTEIE